MYLLITVMYIFVVYIHIYTWPNTCEFNSGNANSKSHKRNNSNKMTINYSLRN